MPGWLQDLPIATIGVWGVYVTTVVQGSALIRQIWSIYRGQSVRSISSSWIMYFTAMFCAGIIYGATHALQPVLINNLVFAVLHLILLIAIERFRGLSKKDRVLLVGLSLGLVGMLGSDHRDPWFIAFAAGGFFALLLQAYKIWADRCTGVLSLWYVITCVASNFFWTIYAFIGHDRTLKIICPANLVACIVLLGTWWAFRRRTS